VTLSAPRVSNWEQNKCFSYSLCIASRRHTLLALHTVTTISLIIYSF